MAGRSGVFVLTLVAVVLAVCFASASSNEEALQADRVAVYKAKRKLYLCKGERVLNLDFLVIWRIFIRQKAAQQEVQIHV